MWWGSIPPDQQPMDDHSLVYDSEPLTTPMEILGRPIAKLNVSADATRANWVVQNLGRRTGRAGDAGGRRCFQRHAQKLGKRARRHRARRSFSAGDQTAFHLLGVPGRAQDSDRGQQFSMWPMLWPTQTPFTSTLEIGGDNGARIELPVIPTGEERAPDFKRSRYLVLSVGRIRNAGCW